MNRCIATPEAPRPQDSKATSPQAESASAANLALFPHRLAPQPTFTALPANGWADWERTSDGTSAALRGARTLARVLSLVATNVQKSEDHARRRPNLGEDSDMSVDSSSLSRRSVGSVAASVVTDTAMVAASWASPWIVLRSLALMGRL